MLHGNNRSCTQAVNSATKNLCIFRIVDGLCEGLSSFSGPSRAALIYAENATDPVRIYDPQNLLQGHQPKLHELYMTSQAWREEAHYTSDSEFCWHLKPEKNLELAGLISFGGRTRSIYYQMWFTEHHPDMCSIGPTERWLEHAVCLLAHDFANQDAVYLGSSRYVIREYKTHAVRDHIRDRMNILFGWDTQMEVYPILDAILVISRTPEEGAWPRGKLVCIEPSELHKVDYLIRFPPLEQPSLKNFKHVRKLLISVEDSHRVLVSDGKSIVGIASGKMPDCCISADFMGSYGLLKLAGDLVGSFSDGSFHSTNRKPKLVELEEALLETPIESSSRDNLFQVVTNIVHQTSELKQGCTIVIDLNYQPLVTSGQKLERPIDLLKTNQFELSKALANIDGALHIRADLKLHAFACLLDGRAIVGEDRARGARFNSALRFTAQNENVIVVVVSSDRRISVLQGGIELTAQCEWKSFSEFATLPPTLEQWLANEK